MITFNNNKNIWDPTAGEATKPLIMNLTSNDSPKTLQYPLLPAKSQPFFYAHDANKNVTEIFDNFAASPLIAHYEYDAFGKIARLANGNSPRLLMLDPLDDTPIDTSNLPPNSSILTENIASLNPFRFSSEYHDSAIGLVYYNYRHYNPNDGRWLSRDPIEKNGGYNLYGMVRNNAINSTDIYGLIIKSDCVLGSYSIKSSYANVGVNVAGDADDNIDNFISTMGDIDIILNLYDIIKKKNIKELKLSWVNDVKKIEEERQKHDKTFKISDQIKTFPPSFGDFSEILDLIKKAGDNLSSAKWGYKVEGFVKYMECLCKNGENYWSDVKKFKLKATFSDTSPEGSIRLGGFETWKEANSYKEATRQRAIEYFISEFERKKKCKK